MPRTTLALTAIAALIVTAQAEPVLLPPVRPYPAVAVAPPEPFADADFEAFRRELAAVARSRVHAGLARLMAAQGFFWERDFRREFRSHRPAVDNLAEAVRLEHGTGDGWETLAAFATEGSAAPLPAHPGVICAPREPRFEGADLDRLILQTGIEAIAWAYPRKTGTALREAPQLMARVRETLQQNFARLIADDPQGAATDRVPALGGTRWYAVAAPSGRTGFVAPGALLSLASPRLCYGKDGIGRWRITGYVGAAD